MAVKPILQLGNPLLYQVSKPVLESQIQSLEPVIQDLHDTMMDFRQTYGVGRAIAAPQIGVFKRLIYMHIDKPVVFINPEFTALSEDMMEIWDDCMSFPDLMVKVLRHEQISISFLNEFGESKNLTLVGDLSELLQHEMDHLDGILATMRAVDDHSFALKSEMVKEHS